MRRSSIRNLLKWSLRRKIDEIENGWFEDLKIISIVSYFSSANVWIGRIGRPIQILDLFISRIETLIAFSYRLRLLGRLDPPFFFAVVLSFSTVMIVRVFLALPFSPLVWVPPILSELFNSLELLLLALQFFLLLLKLFLLFFLFSLLFFSPLLLLDRSIHIQKLAIFV